MLNNFVTFKAAADYVCFHGYCIQRGNVFYAPYTRGFCIIKKINNVYDVERVE